MSVYPHCHLVCTEISRCPSASSIGVLVDMYVPYAHRHTTRRARGVYQSTGANARTKGTRLPFSSTRQIDTAQIQDASGPRRVARLRNRNCISLLGEKTTARPSRLGVRSCTGRVGDRRPVPPCQGDPACAARVASGPRQVGSTGPGASCQGCRSRVLHAALKDESNVDCLGGGQMTAACLDWHADGR